MDIENQREKLLLDTEVARILRLEPETVRRWRKEGKGPKYIKLGPTIIRYRPDDVREWIDSWPGQTPEAQEPAR